MADVSPISIFASTDGLLTAIKFMSDVPKGIALAEKYTLSDLRGRIPSVVSREVCKVYNIPRREVKPSSLKLGYFKTTGADGEVIYHKSAGTLKFSGNSLATLRFVYKGRLLTPVHFQMIPLSASMNPRSPYTIRMRVKKAGGRKVIGQHLTQPPVRPNPYKPMSGNILFPTGAISAAGTSHIPIQRMNPGHRPKGKEAYKKFTTLSMPQMVSSEDTRDGIMDGVAELVQKRLNHQISRVIEP